MSNEQQPIIRRIKKVSGGAHGGAWKVAYADFVTAMMAFFLLLWLLNSTSQEQKEGLSDYFTPTVASTETTSGAGDILSGISLNTDGSQASAISTPMPDQVVIEKEEVETSTKSDVESFEETIANREQEAFEEMARELKVSILESIEFSALQDQVLIDVTEEGMRIQLIDKDNQSMFKTSTAELYSYASRMLVLISEKIGKLPNRISISGHTDSSSYRANADYSNWELSADRANSARRVLRASGVSADRFAEVTGKANTEPLLPDSPNRPENRRITILVIREAPSLPTNL